MVKNENKKIDKIEKLVEIIATNVLKLTDKVDNMGKDIREVKESNKDIRKNILNLGDRFVSYHTFDQLASRVYVLEKKIK